MKARNLRKLASLALLQSLCAGCLAGADGSDAVALSKQAVVFGADDRREYDAFAANSPVRRWADATALLTVAPGLSCSGGSCDIAWSFEVPDYGEPICTGEQFWTQPFADGAFCTAFLVGPKLFATAGHCFTNAEAANCTNLRVVFGFTVSGEEAAAQVPQSDVYSCTSVIARSAANPDYALFTVDRPVTGRIPHWIGRGETVTSGQAVTLIGHPSQLPLKIDQGGTIQLVASNRISTNSDQFKGSSGGPYIVTDRGVVDALVETTPNNDYVVFDANTPDACVFPVPCEDATGCPGFNTATRTTVFQHLVPLHPAGIFVSVLG